MKKFKTHYDEGDAIEGERIYYQCQKIAPYKKPIRGSFSHRRNAGKMDNAYCVIVKRYRHIPEREID